MEHRAVDEDDAGTAAATDDGRGGGPAVVPGESPSGRSDDSPGDGPNGVEPLVDLRPALGLAGHEVEDLGLEGIPDTGEVLYATQEREEGVAHPADHIEGDIATRGLGH